MKMIEMMNICLALPKCELLKPNKAGVQYIVDKEGERVGYIHWQLDEVVIYTGYEYCKEVTEMIEKEIGKKFVDVKHPDDAKQTKAIINEMIDEGLINSLYGEPKWQRNIK